MRIVVVGGTGLIGSKLVARLGEHGHDAVAAAPCTGVDTLTGEGLADVLAGAAVVIDVSDPPSFDAAETVEYFGTSTRNLLAAEVTAGVRHHVALSMVGVERLPESPYLRAKVTQRKLIESSSIPYSVVHATQFFELVPVIADAFSVSGAVRVPPVLFQPIAGEDVAKVVARAAVASPVNGCFDVAGPERFRMDGFFRKALAASADPREVVTDAHATYFGSALGELSLVPIGAVTLGVIRYPDWANWTGKS